ncbi:hypothetical protein KR074_010271, partial [Drosophila pseudoananassae]
ILFKFFLKALTFLYTKIYSHFEFSNLKCVSFDESFCSFEQCFLKSVNRSYKYGSLKVKLYKVPVNNARVTLALNQRLNGYKPFLYNITFDACKFMKNRNSNQVILFLYNLFGPYSNLNHTCPYNNDVYVEKWPTFYMNRQLTTVLPFPQGDYGLFTTWYSYGVLRASVNVYFTLK